MAYPLPVVCRVVDRHGAALADTDQRELLEVKHIHKPGEITNPGLEGEIRHVAFRKAAASRIVPDQSVSYRDESAASHGCHATLRP